MVRNNPESLTVGALGIPPVSVHALGDIPLKSNTDRWHYVDWGAVRRAVRRELAVSFHVSADEVRLVELYVEKACAEGDVTVPVETKYDERAQRLWIWSACAHLAYCPANGETPAWTRQTAKVGLDPKE